MTMKKKVLVLVLVIFLVVIVAFLFSHVPGHVAFVLRNFFASILPVLRW